LLEDALLHYERLRNPFSIGSTLAILGDVEQRIGDPTAARAHYALALRMLHPLGYVEYMAQALCGLAELARENGEPDYALRLVSLTLTLAKEAHATIRWDVQARLEEEEATARQALGDAEQGVAMTAGQAMTLDQAIVEALGDIPTAGVS
jgi:hypothetical protein